MPRINLLPWREQQRTDRKKAFGVGLGIATIGALALAGLAYVFIGQMVSSQQARNALLREEIKKLDKKNEEINNLEQEKEQMIARMQIIEKLQQSRPEIVHVFDSFVKLIPDGMYLTGITQTDQKFKMVGITQSPAYVASFLEAISTSEWLKDQELEQIENKAAGHEFTVYASQRVSAAADAEAAQAKEQKKP